MCSHINHRHNLLWIINYSKFVRKFTVANYLISTMRLLKESKLVKHAVLTSQDTRTAKEALSRADVGYHLSCSSYRRNSRSVNLPGPARNYVVWTL